MKTTPPTIHPPETTTNDRRLLVSSSSSLKTPIKTNVPQKRTVQQRREQAAIKQTNEVAWNEWLTPPSGSRHQTDRSLLRGDTFLCLLLWFLLTPAPSLRLLLLALLSTKSIFPIYNMQRMMILALTLSTETTNVAVHVQQ